ncbi:HAD-IA family hydrolase [Rummeliibacillus pycnus]|uniref:HAD-IA family hydrolase n=1 Tax=Rummeliibacillus pycnus TaxID=101070 RepID=UPI0037C948C7
MRFEYILFDLDGTLTDPKEGISKSIAYALKKLNSVSLDEQTLELFIGPPLMESFCEFCGFDPQKAEKAIEYYRERFQQVGLYENKVYPGIDELLSLLKKKGVKLAVATSKLTIFAEEILNYFNLNQYFDVVVGSNLDGTQSAKHEVIQEVLKQLSSPSKQSVVMIGDRKYDIIGAQKEGITSIGVCYGYGSREELELAKPEGIVQDIQELSKYLLNV